MVKVEQSGTSAAAAATATASGPGEFSALLAEHQAMVFSIAWHFLHDRAAAEELAQDVFLQLYRDLARLESPAHVVAWLRRVACHRAIDFARRRKLRPETSLDLVPPPAVVERPADPFASAMLRKLVASLPDKARAVVVLRYQEEMELAEIAAALGIPLGTVKSHLQRALAMLREKMQRNMERRG
jgi:RNA polymerase sigma-70 factor, ECF subfamily